MIRFARLRTLLVLGRVSNVPTVWTNVAVGWFLAGGEGTGEFAWILLGMSWIYIAGMTLNDAFDAAWDREHAAWRPIPSGRIGERSVWVVGVLEMLAGVAVLLTLTATHPLLVAALVAAVWCYNALHKRGWGAVWIMGLCRALVYLGAGSAAGAGTLDLPPALYFLAGGAVLYIAGITLAARREHASVADPLGRLPRILLSVPVLFPPLIWRTVPGDIASSALLAVGILGVGAWIVIVRRALVERVPQGVALALAGIAFYDAAAVAFADWRVAVAALAAFVLTLGLQRVVPAT